MMATMYRVRRVLTLLGALLAGAATAGAFDTHHLDLIPADAITIGAVQVSELRASPLGARIFSEADQAAVKGEAAVFLNDAGLRPTEDIDAIVFAAAPAADAKADPYILLLVQGRFDVARLVAAIVSRGGSAQKGPKSDYYRLPEDGVEHRGAKAASCGAIAFLDAQTALIGTEASVVDALARRARGTPGFRSGVGLGREVQRLRTDCTAWILIDMTRQNPLSRAASRSERNTSASESPAAGLVAAMKSVSIIALQSHVDAASLDFSATGVAADEETGQLLEDTLRGVIALWRMAVQEQQPDYVAVVRKIQVTRDGTSVSVTGSLPMELLTRLSDRSR